MVLPLQSSLRLDRKMDLLQYLYGHPSSTILYLSFSWLSFRSASLVAAKNRKYFYGPALMWLLSVASYLFEFKNAIVVSITLLPLIFIWWIVFNPLWMFMPEIKTEKKPRSLKFLPNLKKNVCLAEIVACLITQKQSIYAKNLPHIHQNCTPCASRKSLAWAPYNMANVDIMPASIQVLATTVTALGASGTGQPVLGSSMWL